jgi:hypothetical protein
MKTNLIFHSVLTIAGVLTGWLGWNVGVHGFAVLPFVIITCVLLPRRIHVLFFILGYYMGSTVELLWGAVAFFDGRMLKAAFLWFLLQCILTTAWIILKKGRTQFRHILLQVVGTLFITIFVPPYALLGIANPITASGYYFPASGYWGIGLYILLICTAAYLLANSSSEKIRERKQVKFLLGIILTFAIVLNGRNHFKNGLSNVPSGWAGINTHLGRFPADNYQIIFERHLELKVFAEEEIRRGKKVIIFPESVAGILTNTGKNLWLDIDLLAKRQDAHILLGGYLPVSPSIYDNALFVIGKDIPGLSKALTARISMPVTNWRPLLKPSASIHIGPAHDGVFTIKDQSAAFLICYEQVLVWPLLQSMAGRQKINLIVAVSNIWWAKDTKIPDIMDRICRVWGRLFNISVLRIVNI